MNGAGPSRNILHRRPRLAEFDFEIMEKSQKHLIKCFCTSSFSCRDKRRGQREKTRYSQNCEKENEETDMTIDTTASQELLLSFLEANKQMELTAILLTSRKNLLYRKKTAFLARGTQSILMWERPFHMIEKCHSFFAQPRATPCL